MRHAVLVQALCLSLVVITNGQNLNGTSLVCSDGKEATGTLSVTGKGSVTAVPDIGRVSMRVEVTKPTADEARQVAATATNDTVSALRTIGIPADDIKTVGISLAPYYVWDQTTSKNTLEGYKFSQSLQIDVKNVTAEQLGGVVDAAVVAGGDMVQISGVETLLSPEKQASVTNDARSIAVSDAFTTFQVLSQAANISLGPLTSIEDQSSPGPVPIPGPMAAAAETASSKLVSTPISIGTQEVQAVVALKMSFCGNSATRK